MFEYRVTWKREGLSPKRKVYARRASAERRIALMTSPEPWRVYSSDPDEFFCCSGNYCGCGGISVRENAEAVRSALPPMEYVRLEVRTVRDWRLEFSESFASPKKEAE